MNGTARARDGVREAVERYAADVRRHLGDLAPDQVEDLTDGLEADLADALQDEPWGPGDESAVDLTIRFGDAHGYARELRAAAGLPDEGVVHARPWPDRLGRVGRAFASAARRVTSALRRQPWWEPVARAATDLQPLWWVARAWITYQALMWLSSETSWLVRWVWPERDGIPSRGVHRVLLLVLVVVSVQWGRGRWGAAQLPSLSCVVSIGALVLLLPVGVFTYESRYYGAEPGSVQYVEVPGATVQPDDGVWVDGMQVSNLFLYDADGDPLQDVQVYDDRGRPVRATGDEGYGSWSLPGVAEPWTFVPSQDDQGRQRWNVYPLQGAPSSEFGFLGDGSDPVRPDAIRTPPLPFAKAPALVGAAGGEPSTEDQSPGESTADTASTTATTAP